MFASLRKFRERVQQLLSGEPEQVDLPAGRREMLERHLFARGISDENVLEAMSLVPRENFVSPELRSAAYDDRALGIDCEQTISQPYIVALMTQALELSGREHVLEIGTGSGYQTAVLSLLAESVVSLERHATLSQTAHEKLRALGCGNVTLVVGDGTRGWPEEAPYDRILVTAAGEQLPPALWQQLVEGGVLVAPLGPSDDQVLQVMRKVAGRSVTESLTHCRFVPLISEPSHEDR